MIHSLLPDFAMKFFSSFDQAMIRVADGITFYEQVVYMAMVGSFPFNSFLSGVLSCVGTAVLAGESRINS